MRANNEGREPTPDAGERETAATGAVEAITNQLTRRRLLKSTGPAAIAVGLVWSAPSIRTTVLDPKHAGTPAPTETTQPPTTVDAVGPLEPREAQPVDPGAVVAPSETSGGSLPFTGTDPKSLLIAGGGAIAAGTAAIAFVRDPEPSRGD